MAFDPDKYLAKKAESGSGFDPDAYLAKANKKTESVGKTLLDQAGNAILFGYGPEVVAGATKIVEPIREFLTGETLPVPGYTKLRDDTYQEHNRQRKDNPKAAIAGTIAGSVASALLPVGYMARGGTVAARIGRGAATGAAIGGVSNPGAKEGEIDPLQLGARATNAAIGGVTGAVVQGGIEAIAKTPGLSTYLKRIANEKSFKSTGAKLKDFQKANERGRVQTIGQTLLDEKITTVGATPATIVERIAPKLDDAGNRIDDLIKSADNAIGGPSLDNEVLAKQLKKELSDGMAGIPGGGSYLSKVDEFLDDLLSNGKELTLNQAWGIKKGIDRLLKASYKNKTFDQFPMAEEALLGIRNRLRDSINLVVDGVGDRIGASANELKNQLGRYGNLAEAGRIAQKEMSRASANRTISLTDYISAIGGIGAKGGIGGAIGYGATGDTEGALYGAALAAGGNKLLRTFGNPAGAVAARAGSNMASAVGRRLGMSMAPSTAASIGGFIERPEVAGSAIQRLVNRANLTKMSEASHNEEKKKKGN